MVCLARDGGLYNPLSNVTFLRLRSLRVIRARLMRLLQIRVTSAAIH